VWMRNDVNMCSSVFMMGAGCGRAAQALPTCPDCSRIPLAAISSCSQQMVCGNDQNTYASACLALCQGIDIKHTGSCNGIEGVCSYIGNCKAWSPICFVFFNTVSVDMTAVARFLDPHQLNCNTPA
jgi:hypothetical protein